MTKVIFVYSAIEHRRGVVPTATTTRFAIDTLTHVHIHTISIYFTVGLYVHSTIMILTISNTRQADVKRFTIHTVSTLQNVNFVKPTVVLRTEYE